MRTPSPHICGLDLAPPLADRFVSGFPIDYGPVLLRRPFGFPSRWTPCPPETCRRWLQVHLGCIKCLRLPPRSPDLNAFTERWVRSVKSECLSHFILFGEGSLRRALKNFSEHYHGERNHPGKANQLLFPDSAAPN